MARSGRFGRLPRAAPSLASTIVSLAREMAARQTANYIDAWKNGGLVDGQPVNDDRLLEQLLKRRDGVSENDPLWDTYNNDYLNYAFSIADSKMTLKYAQHKVNETQMANFYAEWANKLPTDSEGYRALMRQSAQFLDAAKARASAGASRARQTAYAGAAQNIYDNQMRQYDRATDILTQAARDANIITPNEDLNDLRASDTEGDQAAFLNLIDTIANNPDYAIARAQLADLGLEGLNYSMWRDFSNQYETGVRAQIALAQQYGDTDGSTKWQGKLTDFIYQSARFNDIDEIAAYTKARDAWEAVVGSTISTDEQKVAANNAYLRTLDQLHAQASSDQTRAMLSNELGAVRGSLDPNAAGSTLSEQLHQADRIGGDAAQTNAAVLTLQARLEGKRNGSLVTTYQTDDPTKDMYGVAPSASLDPRRGILISMPTGVPGQSTSVWVEYHPVQAQGETGIDPNTLAATASLNAAPGEDANIGVYFTVGNHTYYGVYMEGGGMRYSDVNPFVQPDGSPVNLQLQNDGTLVIGFNTAANETGFVDNVYHPRDVIPPEFLSDRASVHRNDNPLVLLSRNDPTVASAILYQNPQQIAAILTQQYGSPEAALAPMQAWTDARNVAVQEHNAGLTPEEIALGLVEHGFSAGSPFLSEVNNPLAPTVAASASAAATADYAQRHPGVVPSLTPQQQQRALASLAAKIIAQSQLDKEKADALARYPAGGRGMAAPSSLPSIPGNDRFQQLWDQYRNQFGAYAGTNQQWANLIESYGQSVPQAIQTDYPSKEAYANRTSVGLPSAAPPGPGPSYGGVPTIQTPQIQVPNYSGSITSQPNYGLEGGLNNYLNSSPLTTPNIQTEPQSTIDPVTGRPRRSGPQEFA